MTTYIDVGVSYPGETDPRKTWPAGIVNVPLYARCVLGAGRKSVRTRRAISAVLGTDAWVWTGPNTIAVTKRSTP